VIAIFNYLNNPTVNDVLFTICNAYREELQLASDAFKKAQSYDPNMVAFWDLWIRAHFARMTAIGKSFVSKHLDALAVTWRDDFTKTGIEVKAAIATLRARASDIKIDNLNRLV